VGERGEALVTLGRVVGVYGIGGWLKVYSYTRPPEAIFDYPVWLVGPPGQRREIALRQGRTRGRGLVAELEGYTDRDQARELIGADIAVHASNLPPLAPGEYYWHQLIGLRVVNLQGAELGTVDHLMETGANDVLVVRGERERLIPYTPDAVKQIDLDGGVLRVDWDAEF
jgi:16S rRNA processing protein RimM